MKYVTSSTFRRALEDQMLLMSLQGGVTLMRLRKLTAFDRFLARLLPFQPGQWAVNGGFALQLHLGDQALSAKNIDMLLVTSCRAVYPALQKAAALQLEDWFTFEVMPAERQMPGAFGGMRYPVESMLDGRTFENFHIDVVVGSPIMTPLDDLNTLPLLAFAGIEPVSVACFSIARQLAGKLYAYTRPRAGRESSRVKEFVDILLLAGLADLQGKNLIEALQSTFDSAGTHALPSKVPPPPIDWPLSFEKMAHEIGFQEIQLNQAYAQIQQFLDPILEGSAATRRWDAASWSWK